MPTRTAPAGGDALLRVHGLRKTFPGVVAVRDCDLTVHAGEVLALVGENGAGKSTLIKMTAGALVPDAGSISLGEHDLAGLSPARTAAAGVAVVHQELSQVTQLTVRDNLLLGREDHLGWLPAGREREICRAALAPLGLADLDCETRAGRLDLARRQLVEIARALVADARLLILDEPTATLSPDEVQRLFEVIGDLRARGLGIVFVSHRLDEVFALADRIAVMRDGAMLGAWPVAELSRGRLIELMVGRPLDREFPARGTETTEPGAVVLAANGLSGGPVCQVSLELRAGEITGLAGLVGAGRTELARLLAGVDRPTAGTVTLGGRPVRFGSPREAIRAGICLLTEDRKGEGLVLGLSARDNFALPNLDRWSRAGWLDGRREAECFQRHTRALGIKLAHGDQRAGELSGGNQQKLLVARWLERDARVILVDEPTRGVDVGAKHEIYLLLRDLARRGKAILMISSELPEVLGLSDRVLVMHAGRLTGEITDVPSANQADVMNLAVS